MTHHCNGETRWWQCYTEGILFFSRERKDVDDDRSILKENLEAAKDLRL